MKLYNSSISLLPTLPLDDEYTSFYKVRLPFRYLPTCSGDSSLLADPSNDERRNEGLALWIV